ncbi:MAG: Acyl carrier protein [Paracidovorax wautersii]|uniref:Acyl carrier protein n=1 Tax=Paracidovorax wautersii TaxID=1177982 RepID=A0A7V8FR53_9BURK|nr:MAG: Acyl carrier protein [Paracidovorax wautersii]
MQQLEQQIKQLIIQSLGLEDITPEDIASDAPLFGDGLGLDSVDALEIGLMLQKNFGIRIEADGTDTRQHFASVAGLAAFVAQQRASAA